MNHQFSLEEAIEWKQKRIMAFLADATVNNRCPGLPEERYGAYADIEHHGLRGLRSLYQGLIVPFQ
jgi:hypothetical protein